MNSNPLLKDQLKLKKKALSLLSKAIAKIILKFRLPRSEFLNSLDEKLVLEAKRQDPDASNVAIAIRTGIDRRSISKHLQGNMPVTRPDKLAVILGDIRWTSEKFYNNKPIPKLGPFKTFQSICEQRASGTLTFNSILNELIKNGNIIDLGDKIELVNTRSELTQNNINYSQITALQINRTVESIIYNFDTEVFDDRFIQRTIYSTQINPEDFNDFHKALRKKSDNFYSELTDLFVSFEEDVNIGTYPEYGFSFLEYNNKRDLS